MTLRIQWRQSPPSRSPKRLREERRHGRVCRVTAGLLMAVGALATAAEAARINDLSVAAATYVGGDGNDAAGGVDVAPDGTLLFAGRLPDHTPGGAPSVDILGGGDGAVVRYAADGRTALRVARLGDGAVDLESTDDGRVAVGAEGLGLVLLDASLTGADWHDPLPDVVRVAAGGEGAALRVAALTSAKRVRVFDTDGMPVGERTFTDSVVADVTVAPDGATVVVTGYNNRNTGGGTPVQIPFLRAYEPTLTALQWRAYDWSADQLVDDQQSSLADSRGLRVAFGEDGRLYFAGRTDGGNHTFRYDPLIADRRLPPDELISFDEYNNTAGISGSAAITVFGRFDPGTGDVLKIQLLLARLMSGNGNSVVPASIIADREGRVFVGGQAFATIQNRSDQRLEGQSVGPYQGGEAYLLVVDPDFLEREVWTVFTAAGGSQGSSVVGVGVRDGRAAWAASLGNATARMLRHEALQDVRNAGDSAYLGTRRWALFEDGFESGDVGAWDAVVPSIPRFSP
ncbi:MAG: hypothetical protein AAGM22_07635 [Acidobacteriota bacterium]